TGVELVPELNLWLAEVPTQEHHAPIVFARIVHEAEARIFELDSELLELALISIELARVGLRLTLELFRAIARILGAVGRRNEVQLEDRLAPFAVLPHDVLDDLANQWEGSIGLVDREQLHVSVACYPFRTTCSLVRASSSRSSRRRRLRSLAAAQR